MALEAPSELEVVDPEGDLVLLVGTALVVSGYGDGQDENKHGSPASRQEGGLSNDPQDEVNTGHADAGEPNDTASGEKRITRMRILVWSKVLIWTSPVFKTMLTGSFAEAQNPTHDSDGKRTLQLPDDDPAAMPKICQIIHHKPNTHSKDYHYESLNRLAILSDKYDFTETLCFWFEHELRKWNPGSTSRVARCSITSVSGIRALELVKLSYVAGAASMFARVTLVSAYVVDGQSLAATLQNLFSDHPTSNGLIARILSMQRHLLDTFTKIATELLAQVTALHRDGNGSAAYAAIFSMVSPPDAAEFRDGLLKQLGLISTRLVDQKLLPGLHTDTVQYYAQKLKAVFLNTTPGKICFCETACGWGCRSDWNWRLDLDICVREMLEVRWLGFWNDSLCLKCVEENDPSMEYVGKCKIHKSKTCG